MTDRARRRVLILVAGGAALLLAVGVTAWILLAGGSGSSEPLRDGSCPGSAPVKGNVSTAGKKIYHEPGWRYYESTDAEECFLISAADARSAGYRESQIH